MFNVVHVHYSSLKKQRLKTGGYESKMYVFYAFCGDFSLKRNNCTKNQNSGW